MGSLFCLLVSVCRCIIEKPQLDVRLGDVVIAIVSETTLHSIRLNSSNTFLPLTWTALVT